MTCDKISFTIHTVFIIRPKQDIESLKIYSKVIQYTSSENMKSKIIDIIQRESKIIIEKLTINDILNNRENFTNTIVNSVNSELNQFGLNVYNMDIKKFKRK